MYHTDVLADKAGLLRSLTIAAKGSMWRSRFAEWATENPLLTPRQIAQFYDFSQFFNNPTKEGCASYRTGSNSGLWCRYR
jgi:hypothetical protein